MKILLLGWRGFLGSHVLTILKAAGHEVETPPRGPFLGPLRWADLIINCVGDTENPQLMYDANVRFTGDLFVLAQRYEKRVIHIGSLAETIFGRSVYRETKRMATDLAVTYSDYLNLDVSVVRLPTLYGPGDKPSAFLPLLWRAYRENGEFFCQNEARDWLHVSDAAKAILAVIGGGQRGDIYNVATNERPRNRQIVREFEAAVGGTVHVAEDSEYCYEWPRFNTEMIEQLGWKPCVLLGDGIREWVQSQPS
jgi:nucleoside-diphosphate-sugar epimerase